MASPYPRNALCPCGSGLKYKRCCIRKDINWQISGDGQVGRSNKLDAETADALESLRAAQREALGREPERVFEGAPPPDVVMAMVVQAMKTAGIDPALIHAYEQTGGLMVSESNEDRIPAVDVAEWEAAIDEYEHRTGTTAMRRRLVDGDLQKLMAAGPPML